MKKQNLKNRVLSLILAAALLLMSGCSDTEQNVKLDPKNPITISVWHYYNGAIMNAFEAMIQDFNETVGLEQGIIVEFYGHGNVAGLEEAVLSSANKEVGSSELPNIFASYADMAYEIEKLGLLANLEDYFTTEEQNEYLSSYIEEGKIGRNGELRIFPVAKSTEIMMVNETDWLPFANANGLTYDDLSTMEGVARVAEIYYHWTDSLTPEVENDGKSFFGRDVMANFFIIAAKEFDTEIFKVENGTATISVNAEVMRKIWDYYYVPYISGYFSAYGKYRSDDAKVGDILAYVGSTASASYFPSEVTAGGSVYPVTAKILPAPHFEEGGRVMVQQGAGMVVTKSTREEEYASVLFLKWFTETQNNIEFASLSGYMPVKEEAIDYELLKTEINENGITLDTITDETLKIALEEIKTSQLYTNKAFSGGAVARSVLEYNFQDKAVADREAVLQLIEGGSTHEQAVAQFNTDDLFNDWLEGFTIKLNEAAK